ncbi:hypothetical protein NQ314_004753 [Rhamnusium bicolor]|uniref:RAP domain-containing protein n=1 Tax=Rhamnusium bicolor TaxID=1586634 RepID=A0AAV8ZLE5_9CUCU|nr:hypothetical protein NQ314_004753 [Rhamnusium bicolor]
MSQTIKVFSNLLVSNPLKYGFVRHMCLGKDLTISTSTSGPDFLLQNLKNAPSPKNVLKIVNEHYKIMNSKHIMQALRSLFDLQKYGRQLKSVIWSITDMEPNEIFEPLMNKAMNNLIVHIDNINYTDMESTLSRLVYKYSRRYPYFYNEIFVDTCANYIIDHNLGFKHAVYTLRKLGRIAHINKYLLDYTSKLALEDPTCIINADSSDIYSIAIATSLTDYKPIHWDNLKDLIVKKKNLAAEDRKEIIWIRFAASLCLLDIYKIDVITRALIPEYLNALFKKGFMSDFENYFAIWQSIKLNRPEFSDILPSKYEPENLIDKLKEIADFPLESSLQKGMGGEQYVISNLVSRKGHQIDHAVLFRKGGYPVALGREFKFIEDIEIPPENELLLILVLQPIHYTINSKTIREAISTSIKTLEVDGYSVVTINLEVWESLSEFEKNTLSHASYKK